jgi:L-cystine uptake protein TcyP (sodium:dicarboxylate symporter family)
MSYVLSGIAIVICAGIGATAAWLIVSSMGLDGVGGALATTAVAMVLATLLFAVGVALGKVLGLLK